MKNFSTTSMHSPAHNSGTCHETAINPGARNSLGVSLAPGPSSTACDDQLIERRDCFEIMAGRISRNRDMWRGQCERQAAEIERLRETLKCIAQTRTKPGDDKATLLLASVTNLANAALAQEDTNDR